MDTLTFNRNELSGRTLEFILAISILGILVLSQFVFHSPIYANDLIANTVISGPAIYQSAGRIKEQINPEYMQRMFDYKMRTKYAGLKINNVTPGVAHVKMVKYYGGKPVKINIVEMNSEVAKDYEFMRQPPHHTHYIIKQH